jgi:putative ABC transport system permease protein
VNVLEQLRAARRGLLANRLRTALTMLGIVIGVGAVILLVAVGNGSAQAVQQNIEALGTNTLTVMPLSTRALFGSGAQVSSAGARLTPADVKALESRQATPDVKAVSPIVNVTSTTASYEGTTYTPSRFIGTNAAYRDVANWKLAGGRFIDRDDDRTHAQVAVIGQTVAGNLFGARNPLGAQVRFGSATLQIVGVLASKGSNGVSDQDDVVIAPLGTVEDTLTGSTGSYGSIMVQARSRGALDDAEAEVTSVLLGTHRVSTADFRIINQGQLLSASSDTNHVFTVLLGAVAAISLFVGGIGVMNIMLVTVTERTREIGIRKAIGARHGDILSQFLLEAVLVSVAGGLIGVVAGIAGSHFEIIGVHPVVEPSSVLLAFGVAIAVGLVFGGYPANRAASLQPIEALRYE